MYLVSCPVPGITVTQPPMMTVLVPRYVGVTLAFRPSGEDHGLGAQAGSCYYQSYYFYSCPCIITPTRTLAPVSYLLAYSYLCIITSAPTPCPVSYLLCLLLLLYYNFYTCSCFCIITSTPSPASVSYLLRQIPLLYHTLFMINCTYFPIS